MRFSIWLVVLLALMPAFVLFAGLSVAGGLRMPVEWIIMALFGGAVTFVGWEARRDLSSPPH
jgi:hypothetical protein